MIETDLRIKLTTKNDNAKSYYLYPAKSMDTNKVIGNIYCDKSYRMKVITSKNYDWLELFINDQFIKESETGFFDVGRAFINYYGSIVLTIGVNYNDYVRYYKTNLFIACFPRNSTFEQSIVNMIEYIGKNNHIIEYKNTSNSINAAHLNSNFTQTEKSNFFNEVLSKTYEIYNNNYKYFVNKAYKTYDKTNEITDFEKLAVVNNETIIHILTHPDELVACDVNTGIEYENNYYYPRKTKLTSLKEGYKNYENEVILSFLLTVMEFLNETEEDIKNIQNFSNNNNANLITNNGYTSSSEFLLKQSYESITNSNNDVLILKRQFKELYTKYYDLFSLKTYKLTQTPRKTKVFETIRHYSDIYNLIVFWFNNTQHLLENQKLNIHLAKSDLLYEHYVLLKLINTYIDSGYKFTKKSILKYDVEDEHYINLIYYNYFEFQKDEITKVVYYQPVISTNSYKNGINLYRSVHFNHNGIIQNENKTPYYTPDYILKTIGETEEYTIIDAKFSKSRNILRYGMETLIYKYIFSVNPTKENVKLMGFLAICGKNDEIYSHYSTDNIKVHNVGNFGEFNDKSKNFSILTLDPVDENEPDTNYVLKQVLFD